MHSTFRTLSTALVSGMILSQVAATLSAQATPQQNTNTIAQSTQGHNENRSSTIVTNIKKLPPATRLPKLKICNFTSDTVHYSINGSNSSLASSACITWRLNNVALLSFDKLFMAGYQKQTYELSAGQYIFQGHYWGTPQPNVNNSINGLNIFKFQSVS